MGVFVTVFIEGICPEGCKKCVDSCPVNIFEIKDGKITISDENEDECTFCNLCLEVCPRGIIRIKKEY